ncbi:hypothetical protein SRHO_G00319520 [Serrasalmus rhombeus]
MERWNDRAPPSTTIRKKKNKKRKRKTNMPPAASALPHIRPPLELHIKTPAFTHTLTHTHSCVARMEGGSERWLQQGISMQREKREKRVEECRMNGT